MSLSSEIYVQRQDATNPFMRAVLQRWFVEAERLENAIIEQEKLNSQLDRELHEAILDPEGCGCHS